MKRSVGSVLSLAGVTAALVLSAQPAWANSFTTTTQAGTVSYNDGQDRFCASAYNTEGARYISVQLTPISRSGPSRSFTERNNYYGHPGSTCTSLATAYEDTRYRAILKSYWGETGTVQTKTVYFYS